MKNTNTAVVIPRHEFDRIDRLLDTVRSQSEMIARLTFERNERFRRETLAVQRRTEVFRIPAKS